MTAQKSNKAALFIVFFVVVIDLLGFGIVLPLLPQFSADYLTGYSETMKGVMIGALMSSFSLMQFIFSPVLGRISDRVGRKPILTLSLLGSVLCYALFGYACTITTDNDLALTLLMISRIGAGIAGGSVSTASAVIADSTSPEKRSHGMALIGAAFGIGFTFGPIIAAIGYDQDQRWIPGAIASTLSGLALILAILKLPETRKPNEAAPPTAHRGGMFSLVRTVDVLKMPMIGVLILTYFLAILAFANYEATLALFAKFLFKLDPKNTYWLFAGVGFVLLIAQGGFYRRLAGKVSETTLMKAGLAMMFLGMGGLGAVAYAASLVADATPFRNVFYLAGGVAIFGFAFLNPSVSSLVSRRADPNRQGEILGVNQSFSALGRIIGPVVGSILFYTDSTHVMPYAFAAVLLLIVAFLSVSIQQPESKDPLGKKDSPFEGGEELGGQG